MGEGEGAADWPGHLKVMVDLASSRLLSLHLTNATSGYSVQARAPRLVSPLMAYGALFSCRTRNRLTKNFAQIGASVGFSEGMQIMEKGSMSVGHTVMVRGRGGLASAVRGFGRAAGIAGRI